MSVQVSCPVFRCPKTSVSQCTGHRRACGRPYCETHTEGTLCERCAGLKQEEMKAEYGEMLKELSRQSFSAARTAGVVALFVISLLLLAVAVACGFMQSRRPGLLPVFVVTLGGGLLGLCGSLVWYSRKALEYVRAESVELDLKYPGFYDHCRQWRGKVEEITTNTY